MDLREEWKFPWMGKKTFQVDSWWGHIVRNNRLGSANKAETKADCGRPQMCEGLLGHREVVEIFKPSSDLIIRVVL